ncbi:hypothetical protein Tco_0746318 [Tanacetum coccineum]
MFLTKGKQIWKPKGKLSDNSLNKTKRVWKATGKLIADIGYQWRPTGKKFALGKLNCGYQWRPTGKKFALGELCPLTKLSMKCLGSTFCSSDMVQSTDTFEEVVRVIEMDLSLTPGHYILTYNHLVGNIWVKLDYDWRYAVEFSKAMGYHMLLELETFPPGQIADLMVEPKNVKVDAYIRGLSDNIKGEVTSSRPANLNEVVRMAHKLMEQKSQAMDERILERKKRKCENFQSGNNSGKSNQKDNSRQPSQNNQKQGNTQDMTVTSDNFRKF